MHLTDTAIRALRPKEKDYKVTDGKGLYLLVTRTGSRLWRLKYRNVLGTERKLAIGSYPEISLREARDARDEARALSAKGIDPMDEKRQARTKARVNARNTFSAVARAYIEKNRHDGLAETTLQKRKWFLSLLEKKIGSLPIRISRRLTCSKLSAPTRRRGTMRGLIVPCNSQDRSSGMASLANWFAQTRAS
jgi:Arm DNA-binding domain